MAEGNNLILVQSLGHRDADMGAYGPTEKLSLLASFPAGELHSTYVQVN